MLSIQMWSPDTCGCQLYQIHDPESATEAGRTPQFCSWEDAKEVIAARHLAGVPNTALVDLPEPRVCVDHAMDPLFGKPHHDRVLDENRMKNGVWAEIVKIAPDAAPDELAWAFDEARNLTVSHPSLTRGQHTALIATLKAAHGAKIDLAPGALDRVDP